MPNQLYASDFKLFMEGIEVPFMSATISCSPNGSEASINIPADINIFSLKPKVHVALFFREWYKDPENAGWRLLFDGFYSALYEIIQVNAGKSFTIICRDARMDLRKSPAALTFETDPIDSQIYYNYMGIYQSWVVRGYTPKSKAGAPIQTYDNTTGLQDLTYIVANIAGAAAGVGATKNKVKKDEFWYSAAYGHGLTPKGYNLPPRCGLFFDSIARGIWLQAVGGTTINALINKRVRLDKKMIAPRNIASYRFWRTQSAGATLGNFLMGNARFTSVEAAICRMAAIFQMRVTSCCTPTPINVDDGSPANEFVIDEEVRKFLVKRINSEYGPPFVLNEIMFLPPLDFTAPPKCNLIFPPLYNRITWQHDYDIDITRGLFDQTDVFGGENADFHHALSIQVPNALFNINKRSGKDDKDFYGRKKPPITMQERYAGVNVFFDSVDFLMAAKDANQNFLNNTFNEETKKKINEELDDIQGKIDKLNPGDASTFTQGVKTQKELSDLKAKYDLTRKKLNDGKKVTPPATTYDYLKRHAVIKFVNAKYVGRVASGDGTFNPFLMCGFPCIVFSDLDSEYNASKDVIGLIQQIQHQIVKTESQANVSTSFVMNNARYVDEPTDFDEFGSPLYMQMTNRVDAKLNKDLKYIYEEKNKEYKTPNAKASVVRNVKKNDPIYDIESEIDVANEGYIYAKDLLTVSQEDFTKGKHTNMYVDSSYEPNRIDLFYRSVFGFGPGFMVGNDNGITFMFDTIHEAAEWLRKANAALFSDYDEALKYVYREICGAETFFHGLMGCSSFIDGHYVNKSKDFDPIRIDRKYFGVTGEMLDELDNKKPSELNVGEFSTIRENMPVTAFIKEKIESVERYLKHVKSMDYFIQNND